MQVADVDGPIEVPAITRGFAVTDPGARALVRFTWSGRRLVNGKNNCWAQTELPRLSGVTDFAAKPPSRRAVFICVFHAQDSHKNAAITTIDVAASAALNGSPNPLSYQRAAPEVCHHPGDHPPMDSGA